MKQTIFTTILTLAFSLSVFAQTEENTCPKIMIKAPEYIEAGNAVKVFASFEREKQPSSSKFNWLIIKDDNLTKITESGIIEVSSKDIKNGGIIILVADSLDKTCQSTSTARIFVISKVGSPLIIDEYEEMKWNDEKVRIDSILIMMQKFNEAELFIFLNFGKKKLQNERKIYLAKLLNYLSEVRGLERNRITFLISESVRKTTKYQLVPKDFSDIYLGYEDYLIIKGENFDQLNNFFSNTTKN